MRPIRQIAPDELAQAAADLDSMPIEEPPAYRRLSFPKHALRQAQRCQHGQAVGLCDERRKAKPLDRGQQGSCRASVPRFARGHALRFDAMQRLGEAADGGDGSSVVVDPLGAEVAGEKRDVEVPALHRSPARPDPCQGAFAEARGREAGRAG